MLGIDINGPHLRIVQIRRRGNHFQLTRAITVTLTSDQMKDPDAIGAVLSETLEKNRCAGRHAVMTLPDGGSLIRRLPQELSQAIPWKGTGHPAKATIDSLLEAARKTLLIPSDKFVFDLWFGHKVSGQSGSPVQDKHLSTSPSVLLGAADKNDVEFCRTIMNVSQAKVQGLTIRSLAKINGLLFYWGQTQEDHFAIVYLNRHRADLAILDEQGFITIQPLGLVNDSCETIEPEVLVRHYQRAIQLSQLSQHRSTPRQVFLAGDSVDNDKLESLVRVFQERLDISASLCDRLEGISVGDDVLADQNPMDYLPAIGAALDGLEMTPTWFNFLHPHGMRTAKKKHISWRPFAVAAVLALILMFGFWLSLVQQRKNELRTLKSQILNTEPQRASMLEAKANWTLFQPFVASSKGGQRQQYLNILHEISRLFPDTRDAYVTELNIFGVDRGSLGSGYDLVANGKVRQGDVLTDFINALNQSTLFQEAKQSGSLTEEPGDTLYPFIFSVTCNLERPTGEALP